MDVPEGLDSGPPKTGEHGYHEKTQRLMGILTRPDGTRYVFRRHDNKWLAWDIHDDPCRGMTHKWDKLPKGQVTKFNIDDPPKTISYTPVLGDYT